MRGPTGAADGRRYVFLDAGGDEPPTPEPDALTSEAVEKLRDEVRCLRDRLHREPERGGGEAGRYQEATNR
jgi:hypothetical protein